MDERIKILVVDDKQENLFVIEAALEDLDVDLVMATSGKEALAETSRHTFSLALLDVQMPEMDGYELAEKLRQQKSTANLPFIFLSAIYNDQINIFKGYEKGAFSFILKPFDPNQLINKVKLFISIHHHEYILKKLNEDLERKNQEMKVLNSDLNSFSYSVSHDLRAPLRAIYGYSEILLNEHQLEGEVQGLVSYINQNAKKMGELIESLLAFSKLGQREVRKDKVDMNMLVQSVINERKFFDKENISWRIQDLHASVGDYNLLNQAVTNLIANAVKYSAKKEIPEIQIGSEKGDGEIVYFVRDNGAGFNMRYADKLFAVFQRLHSPAEFEGTGVGLAIVQRIIEKHNGKVWAEGAPGAGATFYFSLPDNK